MTEKRFTAHIEWYNPQRTEGQVVISDNGQPLIETELIEDAKLLHTLLNELAEENEQLKAQLQRYEIDFKQFEKECQECEKGILQIIDDKIQSARELGTVKTVIVLKNLRKEIIKCKD